MPLPSAWVDRLWMKLAVTYGQRFLGLYAGIDLDAVKADWAHELAGYERHPEAIRYALEHLPVDKPPTVLEFRRMCQQAPAAAAPVLESPKTKPDEAILRQVHEKLEAAKAAQPQLSPAAICAAKLRQKLAGGAKLTPSQRHVLECCEKLLGGPVQAPA